MSDRVQGVRRELSEILIREHLECKLFDSQIVSQGVDSLEGVDQLKVNVIVLFNSAWVSLN